MFQCVSVFVGGTLVFRNFTNICLGYLFSLNQAFRLPRKPMTFQLFLSKRNENLFLELQRYLGELLS